MKRIGVPARAGVAAIAMAVALFLGTTRSSAQLGSSVPSIPDWVGLATSDFDNSGLLSLRGTVLATDSTSTQEELPGLGHKFELIGAMFRDTDPENSIGLPGGAGGGSGGNEGISSNTADGAVALAFRNLPPGIRITALRNQLGFKYYFVARTCGGGSPRLTLLVDSDGDGSTNFAVHGHPNPFMACPMNEWKYEDLTDAGPHWEVTPSTAIPSIPQFPFATWDTLETAITSLFPNHKILAGFLVDDSCGFRPETCGRAHYDLVTIENRTLEIWQDTVKK